MDDDYAANDPIFSGRSFIDLWPIMRDDMIAMENQLPLVVLQRLLAVQRGTILLPEYVVRSCLLDCILYSLLDCNCCTSKLALSGSSYSYNTVLYPYHKLQSINFSGL